MPKKLMFGVIGGVMAILVVGMGAGFYLLWNKVSALNTAIENMNVEKVDAQEKKAVIGPKYPLETLIVNLSDPGGNRYLRLSLELELSKLELEKELKMRSSQIKDALLMIISSKGIKDINTAEGKNRLRIRIMERLNEILTAGPITSVFFTEFVIQ